MKLRVLFFLSILCWVCHPVQAQTENDSIPSDTVAADSLEISLMTCGQAPMVYALYGHTAIRVRNLNTGEDRAFNYGSFDMSAPFFVPKFIFGIMDYELGCSTFEEFAYRYSCWGTDITQQVLNLTPQEKDRMLSRLVENYKPENRGYRYNFIYDNCCTRPRDIVEEIVDGSVVYPTDSVAVTYRDLVHHYNNPWPWSKFAIDLVFGQEADQVLTLRQHEFLPEYLMQHFDKCVIKDKSGAERPLVLSTSVINAQFPFDNSKEFFLSPMQCAIIWLVLSLLILGYEIWRKRLLWGYDIPVFLTQGGAGLIVFLLFFFSDHPTVGSNWLILLLNPIPLFYLPWMICKGRKRKKDLYHTINMYFLVLFLLSLTIIPQNIPLEIIPLSLVLLTRSVSHVLLCKK